MKMKWKLPFVIKDFFFPTAPSTPNNSVLGFLFRIFTNICYLLSFDSILIGVRWYLIMVLFFSDFIFSIIIDLQYSFNFLLYSKVTQSHIILHHAPLQVTRYSS